MTNFDANPLTSQQTKARIARANAEAALAILDRVPDQPPMDGDGFETPFMVPG